MMMSCNFYYGRRQIDLLNKMANLMSCSESHNRKPSAKKLKLQTRFVIILTLVSATYKTATSLIVNQNNNNDNHHNHHNYGDYHDQQYQLANSNGASGKPSTTITMTTATATKMKNNFTLSDDRANYLMHDSSFNNSSHWLNSNFMLANETYESLFGQQVGLRDYYRELISFDFDRLVSVLLNELFELNEMAQVDCSRMSSHKRTKRIKRSGDLPEVEGIDSADGGGTKVHREVDSERKRTPQLIRSVNPARNVTHMKLLDRDSHELDQDHLYDEQSFDHAIENHRNDDDTSNFLAKGKSSNRKARRQSSSGSGSRKDRRHSAPLPTITSTTSASNMLSSASATVAPGLGATEFSGESTLEPATANPSDQMESNGIESPPLSEATPQPTEQPAIYNYLESLDENRVGSSHQKQNHRQQSDLDSDSLSSSVAPENSQENMGPQVVEVLPRRHRAEQRRANLMLAADLQQQQQQQQQGGSSSASATSSISAQIPPPEQSPLKNMHHQKERNLATGFISDNINAVGGDAINTSHQQDLPVVPQVGDTQVLDQSGSRRGSATDHQISQQQDISSKEQQLHQLLRLYEMNENLLAKRLKGRPNSNRAQQPVINANNADYLPSTTYDAGMANIDQQQPLRISSIHSNAPYAFVKNGGITLSSSFAPQFFESPINLQSAQLAQSNQQPALHLDSAIIADGSPAAQSSALKYPRINQAAVTGGNNAKHLKIPTISADAARQILEENFYDSNELLASNAGRYAAERAAIQQQTQEAQQAALNGAVYLAPASQTKLLRTASGNNNNKQQQQQVLNNLALANNRYSTRHRALQDGNSQVATGDQGGGSGGQAMSFMRAPTNPMAPLTSYGSAAASSTNHAQHSAPLLRRTSPFIAVPASANNQLAIIGPPYRGLAASLPTTTAYLLPTLNSALPYSSTSARYTKNSNGPIQRQMMNSHHRMGKQTISNSLGGGGGTNTVSYEGGPSDSSSANAQASQPSTATSDPMWSDTQNQEDDYQQAPQTIQITAVPNGFGLNNGLWNGGVVNGFNPLVGAGGWNGWGGPWNGRQVLLVNRQPATVGASGGGVGSEWRQWVLPVAAVLALPLILGALFVPVFLKSIMFLIQILQMLGLLMPPAQLAGHLASSSHSASSG